MHDYMNDDTAEQLLAIVAKYTAASEIGSDSRLQGDLGLDSFDMVNVAIEAQEIFGFTFPGKTLPYFATVNDVVGYIRKLRFEQA